MKYALRSFGIECDHVIFQANNNNNLGEGAAAKQQDRFEFTKRQYLQTRREVEARKEKERLEEEARTGVILYPAPPHDVLLGRGRPNQEFSGNRRFAELVDSQMDRYRSCRGPFEKTCVIMDVVKIVHDEGGRFLIRRSDGWEVVSDAAARKKAGGTFRTRLGLVAAAAAATKRGSDSPPTVVASYVVAAAVPSSTEGNKRAKRKYDDASGTL
jgi:hypothetical protein